MADALFAARTTLAVIPTITAALYATGNCIGVAQNLGLNNPDLIRTMQGHIKEPTITDSDGNAVAMDFIFYNDQPSAQVDKTAVALTAADLLLVVGQCSMVAGSFILGAAASKSIGSLPLFSKNFVLQPGKSLWVQLVTRGGPTWTTTSSLRLSVSVE